MIVCSRPECQTTAGCTCSNRLFEYERLRSDNARLQEQLEAVTLDRDRWYESSFAATKKAEAAEARAARLAALAGFLCDRLDEFDRDINDDADHTAYHGHVAPAKARLRTALSEDSVKEAG